MTTDEQSPKKAPREFWILDNDYENERRAFSFIPISNVNTTYIHVIEYLAYQKLEAELDRHKNLLREQCNRSADLSAALSDKGIDVGHRLHKVEAELEAAYKLGPGHYRCQACATEWVTEPPRCEKSYLDLQSELTEARKLLALARDTLQKSNNILNKVEIRVHFKDGDSLEKELLKKIRTDVQHGTFLIKKYLRDEEK